LRKGRAQLASAAGAGIRQEAERGIVIETTKGDSFLPPFLHTHLQAPSKIGFYNAALTN
jgi:hypothetical protein